MKLTKIEVHNYRLLKDVTIMLDTLGETIKANSEFV